MLRLVSLVAVLISFGFIHPLAAQRATCDTHSGTLYCLPNALLGGVAVGPAGNPFAPPFAAIGSQLSLLPMASPASGVVFSFDRSLGIYTRSEQSLGPVYSDRGETIGKGKVYLGFTYQRFTFSSLDGVSLGHLPLVIVGCKINPGTNPCPAADFTTVAGTTNRLDFKLDQFASFITVGITDRIDVSAAVPVVSARVGVSRLNSTVLQGPPGAFASGFTADQASGIGDVVLRGKATVLRHEKWGLAGGVDVRLPTGNELNFLGSGAVGIKPFAALSYSARISPHANAGYQWNGNSALASTNGIGTRKIPASFYYDLGADAGVSKKFTLVADFLSWRIFDALRFSPVHTLGNLPTVAVGTSSLTTSDAALGFKLNPVGNLLITMNVDVKLDHNGLRHDPIPLVGLSYTF